MPFLTRRSGADSQANPCRSAIFDSDDGTVTLNLINIWNLRQSSRECPSGDVSYRLSLLGRTDPVTSFKMFIYIFRLLHFAYMSAYSGCIIYYFQRENIVTKRIIFKLVTQAGIALWKCVAWAPESIVLHEYVPGIMDQG